MPWRTERDPYRILVAEKLLQQTDVSHVLRVYSRFVEKYPDVWSLNAASQEEIEQILKPLGFWRIRARDLKLMAWQIITRHNGQVPRSAFDISELAGVGRYVTAAMLCFSYGKRQPIVDVNVRRVIHRMLFWNLAAPRDAEIEETLNKFIPRGKPREFNWALLDFSAAVCSKKPKCEKCFAQDTCQYFLTSKDQRS